MFIPNIPWVLIERTSYLFTIRKTPQMTYAELVPLLRRSVLKMDTKGNRNVTAACFSTWRVCREMYLQRVFALQLRSASEKLVWLLLPEERKRQLWVNGYYTHVYTKCENYMLLAVLSFQLMACCWQSRCFSQGIAWLFVNSFFQRHSQEPTLCWYAGILLLQSVTCCDPSCCKPHLKVLFLLNAYLV